MFSIDLLMLQETIQNVLDRVAGKRRLDSEADTAPPNSDSIPERNPGSNGASNHTSNGIPPPKKLIPIKLISRPSNGHTNSYCSPAVVQLHTVQRNGGIPTNVSGSKVVYRNVFDPNDPRNPQPRPLAREIFPERTVIHRVQSPSNLQRRIVHLSPRVVVPIRNSAARFQTPVIRRIVYTTASTGPSNPLPQSSMHNGTIVESQNSDGPFV